MYKKFYTTEMCRQGKTIEKRFKNIESAKSKKKYVVVIGIFLAAAILATGVFASGVLNSSQIFNANYSHINLTTDRLENHSNILISCVDNSGRLDLLMLVSLNKSNGGITAMSIPRNTLVGTEEKINGTSFLSVSNIFEGNDKEQKLVNYVKDDLSIPVSNYIGLDLDTVRDIVDALGGIEFNVPIDMSYDDPYQDLHISLSQGVQTLNGEDAVNLLRYRSDYPEGDLTRIEVQQDFLKEFIKQKLTQDNIAKVDGLINSVSGNIITSYQTSDILSDLKYLKNSDTALIQTFTMPGEAAVFEYMPMYNPNQNELNKLTTEYFKD